jgi:hypothetical protein
MRAALLAVLFVAVGCRPSPGPNMYGNQEMFGDAGSSGLPGPDPFVPGSERLSVGVFYESKFSQVIPIDNVTTHLYIYSNTVTITDDSDHIEGFASSRVTHNGQGFVGFGVNWDSAKDMSAWTHLHVSFKSSDAIFSTFQVGMSNGTPVDVDVTKYGYANDGQWHSLVIPMADFVGVDFATVVAPFVIAGTGDMTDLGQSFLIDDLYFTAE